MKKLGWLQMICMVLVFCAAAAIPSAAQVLTTLHRFCPQSGCADGYEAFAGLVQASDGNFYGTTVYGGANCSPYGCGTVFKISPCGTLITLYRFGGADGSSPYAGLVQASDGNFYGTTAGGGVTDSGTVFKITPGGTLTTLHSFDGTDGAGPYAALVQGTDGNFYGTTENGGAYDSGTVFKITPSGALTTLHSFNGTDGAYPDGWLVQATDGNFYGTTFSGGATGSGYGTVFRTTPSGVLTTLHNFDLTDGANPYAGLVQATDGNFYGTTPAGGANGGGGTVFKITPSGALITLYRFNGSDGANPYAGLVQASDGNFYGTTWYGGANGYGTVFKVTSGGTLTTLHNFKGSDGANPAAGLMQGTNGNFYGTTIGAGANGDGYGTVFRLLNVRPCIVCPAVE